MKRQHISSLWRSDWLCACYWHAMQVLKGEQKVVWSVQQDPFVAQGDAPHSHPIDCDRTGIKNISFSSELCTCCDDRVTFSPCISQCAFFNWHALTLVSQNNIAWNELLVSSYTAMTHYWIIKRMLEKSQGRNRSAPQVATRKCRLCTLIPFEFSR